MEATASTPAESAAPSAASAPPSTSPTAPPAIGDTATILWRDELTSLPAKIIERRKVKDRKKSLAEPMTKKSKVQAVVEEEEGTAEEYEYYVHYVEHDR